MSPSCHDLLGMVGSEASAKGGPLRKDHAMLQAPSRAHRMTDLKETIERIVGLIDSLYSLLLHSTSDCSPLPQTCTVLGGMQAIHARVENVSGTLMRSRKSNELRKSVTDSD